MNQPADPMAGLRNLLSSVDLTPEDSGGKIEFVGADPILPSVHRLGMMSAMTLMANAIAVAAVWRLRTGRGQDLTVDLHESVYTLGQTSFGINAFTPTLNGYPYPTDRDCRDPIRDLTAFHQLKDGRWGSFNAHHQHMLFAWLRLLKCAPYPEDFLKAARLWKSDDLEQAAIEQGLTYTTVRTREEWAKTEQGQVQLKSPVIDLQKIGESTPEPLGTASRPLAGVRVLGCTHAIAGSVVGRTLAEQGADVLYLHSPYKLERDAVYDSANVGTRSAFVDLKSSGGIKIARDLIASADIFLENQRGGAMERLGLGDEELMTIRPGIIIVTLRCFGETGPWANRPGNDRQGTAASGVGVSEGTFEQPRIPPCGTTNDYMAGFQGAAGATAALIRRAKEGGSCHVGVSLVRSAMLLESLGLLDREEAEATGWERRMVQPPTITALTPLGELRRVAPVVKMSETPAYWDDPLLVPRGSCRPEWTPRL